MPRRSTAGQLTAQDLVSVARVASFAMLSAGVVTIGEGLSEYDLGIWAPLVTAALTALAKLIERWARDTGPG